MIWLVEEGIKMKNTEVAKTQKAFQHFTLFYIENSEYKKSYDW